MHSRQDPTEKRLAEEREHFRISEKKLYVKQSPWSKRREKFFGNIVGVVDSVDGEINVRDIEFRSIILASYTNLDAMLADWVRL